MRHDNQHTRWFQADGLTSIDTRDPVPRNAHGFPVFPSPDPMRQAAPVAPSAPGAGLRSFLRVLRRNRWALGSLFVCAAFWAVAIAAVRGLFP